MKTIKVIQIKSIIGIPDKHEKILKGLGLGRLGRSKVIPDNPSNRGMIAKVAHLVKVEN